MKSKVKTLYTITQRKLATICTVSALAFVGVGVGVGCAIWYQNKYNNDPNDVIVSCKMDHIILKNQNDIAHFEFKLAHEMKHDTQIDVEIDSDNANLMEQYGFLDYCDATGSLLKSGPIAFGTILTIPAKKSTIDLYIKLLKDYDLPESMIPVKFNLLAHYNERIVNVDWGPVLYLQNNSPELITLDWINNVYINFGELYQLPDDNAPLTLDMVKNAINVLFQQLPIDSSKLDLRGKTDLQVFKALQPYDNAESIAALILSDYSLMFMHAGTRGNHYWQFKNAVMNLYDIKKTFDGVPSSEPSLFDMTFESYGYQYAYDPRETPFAFFTANNKNLTHPSYDTNEAFKITWDEVYYMEENEVARDQQGYFNALRFAAQSTGEKLNNLHSVIKTIYDGVVDYWPTSW